MKLTEEELIAAIEQEEQNSHGTLNGSSELSLEREENLNYYLGRPLGNEIEGRSQVIMSDVADTIEGLMPQVMRVFMSGDEVVKFTPRGPEDEEGAQQETDYLNHVVLNQNESYSTLYTWFKDALMYKNGYVKAWWDETIDTAKETYNGLTDEEFTMILEDPEVEPIEHESYPDEMAQEEYAQMMQQYQMAVMQGQQVPPPPPMPMLHDLKVKRTNKFGRAMFEPVPGDELKISRRHSKVSLEDCPFVQHARLMTLSEIREMGYKIEDTDGFAEEGYSPEKQARNLYEESWIDDSADKSQRRVTFKESYIKIDGDGDGIAELHKVCSVGHKILEDVETDSIPFYSITPTIMQHSHIGRCPADQTKDIQAVNSVMLRSIIDNTALSNNSRYAVNVENNKVNLDDFMSSQPGGLVQVKGEPGSHIMELKSQPVGQTPFNLLEFMAGVKENRIGNTRYNQGLDADSLNKTATGITAIMGAAQQKVELLARTFAETGVKDLFLGVHALILKNQSKPQKLKLRNKWVSVDPRGWTKRTDMSIAVGLGTGNKDQMLQHLSNIIEKQAMGLQIGIATPKNMYNAHAELVKNAGFRMPELFFTDPQPDQTDEGGQTKVGKPPQGPPPDPAQQQAEMQSKMAEAEMNQKLEQNDKLFKIEEAKAMSALNVARAQEEVAKIKLEAERIKFKQLVTEAMQPEAGE